MKTKQHVVVAVDHSDNSVPATQAAALLCRELEARATLVYVVEPLPNTLLEPVDTRVHASQVSWAEEQLAELAGGVFANCDVDTRLVDGGEPVAESICHVAQDVGATLIVMGTHGRSVVGHALFGSTATTVVRHATGDVLTVRPPMPRTTFRKIICAIDFSEGSKVALERAGMLCRHFPAELHAIHVVPTPFWPLQESLGGASKQALATANDSLKQALTEARIDTPHAYVAEGNPATQIQKLADQIDADLVVVGTRGLTGVKRWAIGSVAERVVRASTVPVWCARGSSVSTQHE
jgi:nucleotide-binding universal stress UspA family protein